MREIVQLRQFQKEIVTFPLEVKEELVVLYAFHKKSQKLLEKDKKMIIKRMKEYEN